MHDIEIPYEQDRDWIYRFFEMVPGLLSWITLSLPVVLSLINPTLAAIFIIAFLLLWFVKAVVLNIRVAQGYQKIKQMSSYDWQKLVEEIDNPTETLELYEQGVSPDWHFKNLIAMKSRTNRRQSKDIIHALIVTVYKETRDVVEPTIEKILQSDFDSKKIFLILAYEARGGESTHKLVNDIVRQYGDKFFKAVAIEHPEKLPGEVIGKGGNITFAGRRLKDEIDKLKIDYINVIVTTLDADNKPHPQYFAALTYAYLVCPDPVRTSFQPISVYTNNIWDVPAPMRVVATGNSFWNMALALRPHMIRNFSSHAQSMQTLIDTNFWSVRTIVEDGHQYWRTYFRYNGKHEVCPILVPIYQDAVLSQTTVKTLKAQFTQMKRWAYGASDVAYVLNTGWRKHNKVPKLDLLQKTSRLIESHISWATAPLLIILGAFVPLYLAPKAELNLVANQLPVIVSRIQTIAMIGLFFSVYISIKLLPAKPARYRRHKHVLMFVQWIYLPFTTIVYSGLAALYSQTRLLFGVYLDKFDYTEKIIKK